MSVTTGIPSIILLTIVQYEIAQPICLGSLTIPSAIHDFVFVEGEVVAGEEIVQSIPIGTPSDKRRGTAFALQRRDLDHGFLCGIRSTLGEHPQIIQAVLYMSIQHWRLVLDCLAQCSAQSRHAMQFVEHRDCEDATIWAESDEAPVAGIGGLVPDFSRYGAV